MNRRFEIGLVIGVVSLGIAGCGTTTRSPIRAAAADAPVAAAPTETEALALAVEAYHYFYPLVTMELTRRVTTNVPAGVREGLGPVNDFHHFREFPRADFRDVVRPNFDTLYSNLWLDLTAGPQIVSAPDTGNRYYLLPMLDMWSDVFAVPGKRTSGTAAGNWAVVPPGWRGELPEGVSRIDAPTPHVWVIGRTQTNGTSDYPAVHAVQSGYTVTPLERWGKERNPPAPFVADATVDMKTPPMVQVHAMSGEEFFTTAARLFAIHPPHVTDWSICARIARLGIVRDRPFVFGELPPTVRSGLTKAPEVAIEEMRAKLPTLARVVDGWQMNVETMGVYGNAYLKRAIVAMVGLGANQPNDAVYPFNVADSDGNPLSGDRRYVIHFDRSELPPVDAFWSITLYDRDGFQVANSLNRFAIGDRDRLVFHADGSLDIHVQHASPGEGRESNWLPSPAEGPISLTMRLYAPRPEVLDGRWTPPPVKRIP